ncbi:hypothetical protein AKJ16_DCAP14687, partial [Drosera capensis]
ESSFSWFYPSVAMAKDSSRGLRHGDLVSRGRCLIVTPLQCPKFRRIEGIHLRSLELCFRLKGALAIFHAQSTLKEVGYFASSLEKDKSCNLGGDSGLIELFGYEVNLDRPDSAHFRV